MELSLDMIDVKDADAFIVWAKHNYRDYIIFIDGGKDTDGPTVIEHYSTYIKPHVENNSSVPPIIIVINTHPHNDHVKGIPHIVRYFGKKISRVYMNNPLDYISQESVDLLVEKL